MSLIERLVESIKGRARMFERRLTSEVDDKEPDHDNCCPSSCRLIMEVINIPGEDHSNNEVTQGHADGTNGQDGFTTNTVDP